MLIIIIYRNYSTKKLIRIWKWCLFGDVKESGSRMVLQLEWFLRIWNDETMQCLAPQKNNNVSKWNRKNLIPQCI